MKKLLMLAVLFVMFLPIARAKQPGKYTFNDVELFGAVYEIEATTANRNTTCVYFTDDYLEYLGYHQSTIGPLSESATFDLCAAMLEVRPVMGYYPIGG